MCFCRQTFAYKYFRAFFTEEHKSLNRIVLANLGVIQGITTNRDSKQKCKSKSRVAMLGTEHLRESQQKCTHKTILALMNSVFSYDGFQRASFTNFFSHYSQQNMKALTETYWQIWETMLGTITIRDSKRESQQKCIPITVLAIMNIDSRLHVLFSFHPIIFLKFVVSHFTVHPCLKPIFSSNNFLRVKLLVRP